MGGASQLTTTICPAENANETDPSTFWDNGPHFDAHRVGWTISGVCTLVSTAVSFYLITKHLQFYHKPNHQRYIIRIILLIPIYAIISWLSYRFFRYDVYYEAVRDLYEAFAIAAFCALLTQYVGDASEEKKETLRNKHRMKYPFPFNCFTYEPTSASHLLFVKWGVLQYVVFGPLITLATLITEGIGKYCSESLSFSFARVYLSIIKFCSVTIAMYALITFYVTIKQEISDENPLYKFACIKLVIFLTFWQYLILAILADAGIIKASQYWTSANISRGLGALIICFEMVAFAFLHVYAFDYRKYRDFGDSKRTAIRIGLKDSFNYMDILHEIVFVIKYVWYILTRDKLPDSTSKALNIYGAIHSDDPKIYTPSKTIEGYSEVRAQEQAMLETKEEENVEGNEELMEEDEEKRMKHVP